MLEYDDRDTIYRCLFLTLSVSVSGDVVASHSILSGLRDLEMASNNGSATLLTAQQPAICLLPSQASLACGEIVA